MQAPDLDESRPSSYHLLLSLLKKIPAICNEFVRLETIQDYRKKIGFFFKGKIGYEDFLNLMAHKMAEKDASEEILKAFRLFDDDETGKISFKNLKRVAEELGEMLTDEELQVRYFRSY